MKKLIMRAYVSGKRNGRAYPAVGHVLELPDGDDGADLISTKMAAPYTKQTEKAADAEPEPEPEPVAGALTSDIFADAEPEPKPSRKK